jgi:hypothetical protein
MVSVPPCSIASREMSDRFMMTCPTCPASARTSPSGLSEAVISSISSPMTRRTKYPRNFVQRLQIICKDVDDPRKVIRWDVVSGSH